MNKQLLENEFWNRIYDDYAGVILNTAASILKDKHLAEDVMQEVMFKYYVYVRENDVAFERTWLITVTRNVSFNLLKKLKQEMDCVYLDQVDSEEDEVPVEYPNPESAYIREFCKSEAEELCNKIFEEVQEKHKNAYGVIKALYQEKETQKEAAQRLHMSESAFYTMLSRVKGKLRKQYGKKYAEITKI